MTKHNTDKNFKCKECGKSFKSPTSMKEQSRAHKGSLCVSCKDCDEMFISQGDMLTHKTNKHFIAGVHMCLICHTDYHHKYNLKRHMVGHTDLRPFTCCDNIGCGKTFQTIQNRNIHEKWHRGVNDYHCIKCQKKFMQPQQLSVHMKSRD